MIKEDTIWTKGQTKTIPTKRAVAYYRHSAQDRQENSVEIQQDQVRKFAAENGMLIIREFADKGKSGLSTEGRDEFNEMIHVYVEGKQEDFQYVLVLDVSRWGRFQETDLSAYYTGLCLQNGKQVIFTTIGFPKENDLLHGLHLSIERYRAASYSRELSGKVWKGCSKIASSGFWAGGSPPYGTRRLLLDEKRNPVRVLEDGEHKAIHNQRVTLTTGEDHEVETVNRIFFSFGEAGKDANEIAEMLNNEGIPSPGNSRWSESAIWTILRNEIYAGNMIWNKTSQKMKSPSHPNPEPDWIRAEDAFAPIVPKELFYLIQGIIKGRQQERMRRYSREDMLIRLKSLFDRYGIIKSSLIAGSSEMVSPATYAHQFRSLDNAYQSMFSDVVLQKRNEIVKMLTEGKADVEQVEDFIVIDNLFSVSIQPIVPLKHGRVRLLKRADNGFWYAKYRLPDSSKWVEKSLRSSLLKDAETFADHLHTQIVNKTLGIADGSAPIATLFEKYFTAQTGHIADESVKRFMSSRHNLEKWLEEFHPDIKLVKHLKPSIVRDFQIYRVEKQGVSKRTVDNDITNLHTFFKWGEREGLVEKSPFNYSANNGSVRLYGEPQKDRDTYSKDEYKLLIQEAERTGDILIKDMIVVLADTGLRFGELANLTSKALQWEHETPYIDIRARNGWTPKDPKEIKQIPMTEVVAEVLKRRDSKSKGSYLFKNGAGNQIAENHTRDRLKNLFPAVGITPDRRLHWHSWRNFFVICRLDAGEPVNRIMQWTGHDSAAMVLHYAKARANRLEGVTKFKNSSPAWGNNEKVPFSAS